MWQKMVHSSKITSKSQSDKKRKKKQLLRELRRSCQRSQRSRSPSLTIAYSAANVSGMLIHQSRDNLALRVPWKLESIWTWKSWIPSPRREAKKRSKQFRSLNKTALWKCLWAQEESLWNRTDHLRSILWARTRTLLADWHRGEATLGAMLISKVAEKSLETTQKLKSRIWYRNCGEWELVAKVPTPTGSKWIEISRRRISRKLAVPPQPEFLQHSQEKMCPSSAQRAGRA